MYYSLLILIIYFRNKGSKAAQEIEINLNSKNQVILRKDDKQKRL